MIEDVFANRVVGWRQIATESGFAETKP